MKADSRLKKSSQNSSVKTKDNEKFAPKLWQKIGRWKILEANHRKIKNKYFYFCECDCGKRKLVYKRYLKYGLSKSCGCERNEILAKRMTRHGFSGASEYGVWKSMMSRCYNENAEGFEYYGGRGITVCDSWRVDVGNFLNDMGARPSPRHSIDRIETNLGYCKENCRWATAKEQAINRRDTFLIKIGGEVKSLTDWCDFFGVNYRTVLSRINGSKYSISKALGVEDAGLIKVRRKRKMKRREYETSVVDGQ